MRNGFHRLTLGQSVVLAAFAVLWMVYAGGKNSPTNSPAPPLSLPRRVVVPPPPPTITEAETNLGYRVLATAEGNGIVPAVAATTNDAWRLRGGCEDACRMENGKWRMENAEAGDRQWRFPYWDSFATGLTVFAKGEFRPNVKMRFFPLPFDAPLSLVPQAKWQGISNGGPSVFWHEVTSSNSLVLTWQNALYNRNPSCPTNFQAELFPSGAFDYLAGMYGGHRERQILLVSSLKMRNRNSWWTCQGLVVCVNWEIK